MEAALCLGYGPLPSICLRTIAAPASTKLHFGFNHSSISVSSGGFTNQRRCHRLYSHGPVAVDRSNSSMPSGNEKGVGKVRRGAIGASLALACALSIIGCGCKMNLKAIAGPKQQVHQKAPSFQQIAPLAPRKMALKSLLDVTVNLASKEGRNGRDVIRGPPASPHGPRHLPPSKDQIDQLKVHFSTNVLVLEAPGLGIRLLRTRFEYKYNVQHMEVVNIMKRGQPDEALHKLKTECKKYEMTEPETSYFMHMALIEILICQGKYEEAFEFMSAHDLKISDFDVRPTLYKAILLTMLNRDEEAQELWEEFATSNGGMPPF
ncbi:hypothetical protein PTKIN_Ptkin18bG0097400 [Pterospermum kingtungense]